VKGRFEVQLPGDRCGAGGKVPMSLVYGVGQPFVRRRQCPRAAWWKLQLGFAGSVCFCEIGGREDEDGAAHPIMNVAPQFDDPWLVKRHRLSRLAFVQRQFKGFGGRKGIDVMVDFVP
jgi:hypothetical protein